ncbi:MAG: hypothetical protein JNK79_10025 [Chitinophagaceae bacterium]|nr:hypothetical protein [Chitinophagaceae bacterium]
MQQIKELIRTSRYGIHDLSRSHADANQPPRFNMPFELGIDVGCRTYGNANQQEKIILIMEREQYHYHRVLSDISGQDIYRHNDDPKLAVAGVREWLVNNDFDLPGANQIWIKFNEFKESLQKKLRANNQYTISEIRRMAEAHYIKHVIDAFS